MVRLGTVWGVARVLLLIAAVCLALVVLLVTTFSFIISYGNPPDTYTGQAWDQAASWLLLSLSQASIALVCVTAVLPARVRRAQAMAKGNGQSLVAWLRGQPRAFLIRNLTSVNLPVTGLLAVPVTLAVNISHGSYAPSLPAESLFGAVAAALGITALELGLLGPAPKG